MMRKRNGGFTLLEVVIAVTLMAFLSVFTAMSITRALRAKEKIQTQVDRNAEIRDVLNFMTRDLELAFNYRDIDIELYNLAQQLQNSAPPPTGPVTPTAPSPPPEGGEETQKREDKIVTHFIGETNRVDFSSLSNIRTQANEPLSRQAEVGYYLDGCPGEGNCLWRRVSPFIDERIKEGGTATPLLQGVQELTFRYLGPGFEEEWTQTWRSDGSGAETMKDSFPYAVEISLEVEDTPIKGKEPRSIKISKVARIRFPNNPKKSEDAQPPPR